jgi:predicted small secreted protein
MEKVNVMKKIALFLTVVAVAVVFAACQGAVGPAGDDGKDGDAGQKGDTGPQGPPGVSSLVAVSSLKPYIINDVEAPAGSGAAATIGALPEIDGSMLFTGGHLPRTYTLTEPEATSVFTVSIDKDTGAVTVAARTPAVAFVADNDQSVAAHYGTGTEFTVVAKDTFGTTATSPTISVKRNRKPRAGNGNLAAFTVGTQDVFAAAATPAQKMNECNKLNVHCAYVATPANITTPANTVTFDDLFDDEDPATLVFGATASDPAASVAVMAKLRLPTADANDPVTEGKGIVVTGKSGGTTTDGAPAIKSLRIDVSVSDAGDKAADEVKPVTVMVNPAPTRNPKSVLPTTQTFALSNTASENMGRFIVANVRTFFVDDGDLSVTAAEKSDEMDVLTNLPTAAITDDTGDITVDLTGNKGTATVEITATETTGDLGQYVKATVTVVVN